MGNTGKGNHGRCRHHNKSAHKAGVKASEESRKGNTSAGQGNGPGNAACQNNNNNPSSSVVGIVMAMGYKVHYNNSHHKVRELEEPVLQGRGRE